MALTICALMSKEFLRQSVVGFTLPGNRTWLLDGSDPRVCTVISTQSDRDSAGNVVVGYVSACYVAKVLAKLFPWTFPVEIFRIHLHKSFLHRENSPDPGKQIGHWRCALPAGQQECFLYFEHLSGPYWTDCSLLADKVQTECSHELILTCPYQLAPSPFDPDLRKEHFSPHPGLQIPNHDLMEEWIEDLEHPTISQKKEYVQ